jgi:transcriptional regulator with XRE-family HTH domain
MENKSEGIRDVMAEVKLGKDYSKFLQESKTKLKVGVELFETRERMGISQRELARLVGSTQKVISYIETGDVNPGICLLQRIAQVLKIKFIFGDATLSHQGMTIKDIVQFNSNEGKEFFREKVELFAQEGLSTINGKF